MISQNINEETYSKINIKIQKTILSQWRLLCNKLHSTILGFASLFDIFYVYQKFPPFLRLKIDDTSKSRDLDNPQLETPITMDILPSNLAENSEQIQTTYFETGVGIYQGELVAIRKWAIATPHPLWLVYKFPPESLNRIGEEVPQQLRYLACLLEKHYTQPSFLRNYLQMTSGLVLKKCPLKHQLPKQNSHPLLDDQDNPLFGILPQQEILKEQSTQVRNSECQKCPLNPLSN
jgi:hypothetical protein